MGKSVDTTPLLMPLNEFRGWMLAAGFREETPRGEYEVARFRKPDPSGDLAPVMVYRNKREEMSVYANGNVLDPILRGEEMPHRFAGKSAPHKTVEAEAVRAAPASADDLPW